MSDAEWDADDFEPKLDVIKPKITDKWEGEDEDDDVKDNWDDEEEEEENDEQKKTNKSATTDHIALQQKKKKSLKERIAEKEEQRRKELEEKLEKKRLEEEEKKQFTPKQMMEEKLRRQKIQEEADLALAIEAFGLDKTAESKKTGEIESFEPSTKEDFDKLKSLLKNKLSKYEKSPLFVSFLENLFRDLVLGVEAEDIKKLITTLTALYNEKLKHSKTKSKKKNLKKASLMMDDNVLENYEDVGYDDDDL